MADFSNKSKLWYILEELQSSNDLEETEDEETDWFVNIESNRWDTVKSTKTKTSQHLLESVTCQNNVSASGNVTIHSGKTNESFKLLSHVYEPENIDSSYINTNDNTNNFQNAILNISEEVEYNNVDNINYTNNNSARCTQNIKRKRESSGAKKNILTDQGTLQNTKKEKLNNINSSHATNLACVPFTNSDSSVSKFKVTRKNLATALNIDLIPCLYSRGTLVWAKIMGYSFWPAMVDEDPDNKSFFWIENISKPPTHYHVVFFDTKNRLSRSWCSPFNLKPFTEKINSKPMGNKRFKESLMQAKEASLLKVEDRLKKFGFVNRLQNPNTKLCDS